MTCHMSWDSHNQTVTREDYLCRVPGLVGLSCGARVGLRWDSHGGLGQSWLELQWSMLRFVGNDVAFPVATLYSGSSL